MSNAIFQYLSHDRLQNMCEDVTRVGSRCMSPPARILLPCHGQYEINADGTLVVTHLEATCSLFGWPGDLKPENVMLKTDSSAPIGVVAKITDFGGWASLA